MQNNSINNKTSELEVNEAYALPTVDGAADYVLTTNGAGVVSWSVNAASSGALVQVVTSNTSSWVTCATTIPIDDTIPQQTEGTEVLTATITPTNSSNILLFQFNSFTAGIAANINTQIALFQDATAGAIAADLLSGDNNSNTSTNGVLVYSMAAGTTSSTTFKIRVGANTGTTYLNGNGGGRFYGGVASTELRIMEVKA